MNVLNNTLLLNDDRVQKSEVEQVIKEKLEYTLLGTYLISKGYNLFYYSSITGKIGVVEIKRGDFIQCELLNTGDWIWFDPENFQTTIDSKNTYFESLNIKTAENRVKKFKAGQIKELFNLKKPTSDSIDFFKEL